MEVGILILYALVVLRLPMWLSLFCTWLHCGQEVVGNLPSYFEKLHNCYRDRDARLVLQLPHPVAVIAFGPGLAVSLSVLALIGYGDMTREPAQASLASIALAALCGARLGDAALSHVLLAFFKRPNPGSSSCVMYVCEGLWISLYISWGAGEIAAALLAVAGFWLVNPVIGLVGLRLYDGTQQSEERAP